MAETIELGLNTTSEMLPVIIQILEANGQTQGVKVTAQAIAFVMEKNKGIKVDSIAIKAFFLTVAKLMNQDNSSHEALYKLAVYMEKLQKIIDSDRLVTPSPTPQQ